METQLSLRNKILVNEKAVIRLLTVRAHMLTNIDKHLTCNMQHMERKDYEKVVGGDGRNHYCFVRGRKLGWLGWQWQRQQFSSFLFYSWETLIYPDFYTEYLC
jgi:hypothetical protein